jgi:molybdopterin-guanine dinucleotide biosynthesis protein A
MVTIPDRPLIGVLLAGGKSTRMGVDKANLQHPAGGTLARRTYDLLRAAGCESVVISLRQEQPLPADLEEFVGTPQLEIARDPAGEARGPMAGIVAAMQLAAAENWLVVACDLPHLDLSTLVKLRDAKQAAERWIGYWSEADGLAEPLCAIYAAALLPLLEAALAAGNLSLRKIFAAGEDRLLELPTAGALANANTPVEWAQLAAENVPPAWQARLHAIWISEGNNFRGRHEKGRLHHEARGVAEIECVAGMGLRGDRYFGYRENFKGQVTFFDVAAVAAVRAAWQQPDLCSSQFRRNLIVSGIDLAAWVGRRFRFQGVEFEGAEECKPCYWMDQVIGAGAEDFLKQGFRGGLRARILSDGWLRQDADG